MALVLTEVRRDDGDDRGVVGIVTLNDPGKRNALSAQLVTEFMAALDELESNPELGAIVVTAVAPVFCAGADLGSLDSDETNAEADDQREARLRRIYSAFVRVSACAVPTVAAVNGAAVGAGMNLALACDVRVAGRSARFDTRFLDLGLHPGGGHSYLLERAVGTQAANAMILFGERLDADAAVDRGLVWRCVADDDLFDESMRLASHAASTSRALAERAKATLNRVRGLTNHSDAVDIEVEAQLWSLGQPFFKERLAVLRQRVSKSAGS